MYLHYVPHAASYQVAITAECPYVDDAISTFSYQKKVKHLKSEKGVHFIEVSKSDLLLNEEEVQDAFNDVLVLTARAIERVVVKMDSSGYAVGLENFDEIKRKWQEVRKMAEETHHGEAVANYLSSLESKLQSPEVLWKALSRSYFYTAFFNGLYKNYGTANRIQEDMLIPDLLPTQRVGSAIIKKIALDEQGQTISILVNGEEQFNEFTDSTREFFKEEEKLTPFPASGVVKVKGSYTLNQPTHQILSASLESEINFKGACYKKMHIQISLNEA